ncbi:serine/threonine-kinase pknF domain protein [Mycobacterium kansasii 732]|nr:serine/threonine-kinase pknF domain protein [Mycobacterium kansasii 732]
MGEVYLAQHPRLPRREALKILGIEVSADADYRRRFIREADVASALWHPNIVRVNDRGEFAGKLWISMDFVDGTDAASLLRNRFPAGMPADQVATIISAIASALDYAHQHHKVMHRDVSPANILLAEPEAAAQRILLGDFGIARNIGETSGLTATNMTIGTFPYAAPEQLTGEPIDGRADQYALAATAYHLLTGSPLFPHTNPAVVISRHLTTPPPALAQIHPLLAAFDPVLAVALAKDPADRFACCTDFADAFAHAARRVEHPIASASTMPRPLASRPLNNMAVAADAGKRQRRSRWRLFAAASSVVAVTAVGASGYSFDTDSTPARRPHRRLWRRLASRRSTRRHPRRRRLGRWWRSTRRHRRWRRLGRWRSTCRHPQWRSRQRCQRAGTFRPRHPPRPRRRPDGRHRSRSNRHPTPNRPSSVSCHRFRVSSLPTPRLPPPPAVACAPTFKTGQAPMMPPPPP